ncbi:MAG: DUF6364 family protein [Acidobacteriota bacterium]|nr:DUF6364 family protein [Acidobacteriota bacterium]
MSQIAPLAIDNIPLSSSEVSPQFSPTVAKCTCTRVMGIPYYVDMNVTLSLEDDLIKEIRKIAVEQDTTLTGLVRDYLQKLALENTLGGRKRREREALERSFDQFQFRVGKRTWKRQDLHARS